MAKKVVAIILMCYGASLYYLSYNKEFIYKTFGKFLILYRGNEGEKEIKEKRRERERVT